MQKITFIRLLGSILLISVCVGGVLWMTRTGESPSGVSEQNVEKPQEDTQAPNDADVDVVLGKDENVPIDQPQGADDGALSVDKQDTTLEESAEADINTDPNVICGVVGQGDTAEALLAQHMDNNTFYKMVTASKKAHSLAMLRAGQPFTLVRSPSDGSIDMLEYEIDRRSKLVINRTDSGFDASVEAIEYDCELGVIHGVVASSLFQAVATAGENPQLAIMLADIFGSEINFIRDLREEDSFSIVVEKLYRDGEFKHYGKALGARFVNQGKLFEGFRFAQQNNERYFNAKGESLSKTLLKAPLSFTRITSGYSMNRKHPVFFDRRPHQGVDYGAPSGTPVKAVGDGVVSKAGWGNGFGNMIIVRHSNGLESMYSHLSGFAKGIRGKKVRVKQGQVIGYVGSTGVATGPHLDFRLKMNGKYVNPLKFVSPRGEPISKKNAARFAKQKKLIADFMDGKRLTSEYTQDMGTF